MANQITTFIDTTKLPNQSQAQATFDTNMAAFFANLPTFGTQINAAITAFNAAAAGSAYAIPYTVDLSSTADVDPGNGLLRFDNATQNLATTLRLDLLNNLGGNVAAILDTFDASTSAVKGTIRLVKMGDATAYLMFNVTARATPTGYRDISVTPIASSATNPFVQGDAVLLHFTRTGDVGSQGQGYQNMVVITSTGTWTPPAGTTKAKVTVQDGGYSSYTSTSSTTQGGKGGNAGASVVAVSPLVTYTATIGAGGAANASGTNASSQPGGSSTFSGTGLTTLTTANAALKIPGGPAEPVQSGFNPPGGSSMLGPISYSAGLGYGSGGGGAAQSNAGNAGAAGVVIIEY